MRSNVKLCHRKHIALFHKRLHFALIEYKISIRNLICLMLQKDRKHFYSMKYELAPILMNNGRDVYNLSLVVLRNVRYLAYIIKHLNNMRKIKIYIILNILFSLSLDRNILKISLFFMS